MNNIIVYLIVIGLTQQCYSLLPRIEYCNGGEPAYCKTRNDCLVKKPRSICWEYDCIENHCLCSWICNEKDRIKYEVENNGYYCSICKIFVDYGNTMNTMKKNKASIMTELTEACKTLNKTEDKCLSFMRYYGERFVEGIIKGEDNKACLSSGACSIKATDGKCEICRDFVDKIDVMLHNGFLPSNIIESLKTDCDNFEFGNRQVQCPKFLDTFGLKMIQHMTKNGKNGMCEIFGACEVKNFNDVKCGMCMLLTSSVIFGRKTHQATNEILDDLYKQCSKIGIKDYCVKFLESKGEELIDEIVKRGVYIPCHKVDMCDDTNDDNAECAMCHMVTYRISIGREIGLNDKQIKDDMEEYCNEFGTTVYNGYCKEAISKYGNQIIGDISKDISIQNVCHNIKAC